MVYITGDLHGDISRFSDTAMRPLKKGDTLIVCGDFGFLWDGGKKEQRQLKKLGSLPYTVLFLDGPHENYDRLSQYDITEWGGGRAQVIEGTLIHLLRGEAYTIEGETYFTFGGGESPEHDMRTAGSTWWEEEMPSEWEMLHGLQTLERLGGQVDYIVTHEPSGKANGFLGGIRLDGVNVYLNQLEESVTFRRWFFGSLHIDKPISKRHLAVFRQVVPVRAADKKGKHFR